MNLHLLQTLRGLRASYWFVPSVMLVMAIALGALIVWFDAGPGTDLLNAISWYQRSQPDGARAVLSTIAGSMITVAGVVFSITIVAISFAAGQYGSRILSNFMSDRGNQVTLGTFVATFAYTIVVLRTIHGGDSNFVPQIAVLLALLLALCSIAVLIYFIHHVPESIHINTVTARIGGQLLDGIDLEFPIHAGDAPPTDIADDNELDAAAYGLFEGAGATKIPADADGYLQAIDDQTLLALASKHDAIIRIDVRPGQFLFKGQTLLTVRISTSAGAAMEQKLRRSWTIGSRRTSDQDLFFLIDELVEIAARALVGTNDPQTANTCTDWLSAGIAKLAARRTPSRYRMGEDGSLRLVASTTGFEQHVERGFGRLGPYLAKDINATAHALSALGGLSDACRLDWQRQLLAAQITALTELAASVHEGPSRTHVLQKSETALKALSPNGADRSLRMNASGQ